MQGERLNKRNAWYQAIWRWHFYAGLIFAPIFIILAVTGSIYLFEPQITKMQYKDMMTATFTEEQPIEVQKESFMTEYPDAMITSIRLPDEGESTRIGWMNKDEMMYTYIHPETTEVLGTRSAEGSMDLLVVIHGTLLGGQIGNWVVELAASWAILLLITGTFLFWPRGKNPLRMPMPKLGKGRQWWKQMHGSVALWSSLGLVIIISSGLAWSSVSGAMLQWVSSSTNTGAPMYAYAFGAKPESTVTTKEVAEDVPWATQADFVPTSSPSTLLPIDLNQVVNKSTIDRPYTISLPEGETGVYTVTSAAGHPFKESTVNLDQYSGETLSSVTYADYGILGKLITVGIAFHEGRLFGLLNQLVGVALCLGLIFVVISSFIMWRKRKVGSIEQMKRFEDERIKRIVGILILLLGVTLPLAGISILVVLLFDWLIGRRKLKAEVAA